jgi:membrane protease YdiL (CAAX protease family)
MKIPFRPKKHLNSSYKIVFIFLFILWFSVAMLILFQPIAGISSAIYTMAIVLVSSLLFGYQLYSEYGKFAPAKVYAVARRWWRWFTSPYRFSYSVLRFLNTLPVALFIALTPPERFCAMFDAAEARAERWNNWLWRR